METQIESKKNLLLWALGCLFKWPWKKCQFLRSLDVINVFVKYCKILDKFGANWDHKNGHKHKNLDQMKKFMSQI